MELSEGHWKGPQRVAGAGAVVFLDGGCLVVVSNAVGDLSRMRDPASTTIRKHKDLVQPIVGSILRAIDYNNYLKGDHQIYFWGRTAIIIVGDYATLQSSLTNDSL
jgi:hypothetical protein